MITVIATDLDRTLLPNGSHKKNEEAYKELKKIIKQKKITLIYVTGRRVSQIQDAMKRYNIPKPDYCISMVGTKIHEYKQSKFVELIEWQNELQKQWKKITNKQIKELLSDISLIWPQSDSTSNTFKQSFLAESQTKKERIHKQIQTRLSKQKIPFSFTHSVDVSRNIAQIDIMPPKANKNEALKFLLKYLTIQKTQVLCAGDSGNDLSMLLGGYKSVLVKNAKENVKQDYKTKAKQKKLLKKVYIAQGNNKYNGNYAAGILEAYNHFIK